MTGNAAERHAILQFCDAGEKRLVGGVHRLIAHSRQRQLRNNPLDRIRLLHGKQRVLKQFTVVKQGFAGEFSGRRAQLFLFAVGQIEVCPRPRGRFDNQHIPPQRNQILPEHNQIL
jgi:hypothetical protein